MKATVIKIEDGIITVKLLRGAIETLYKRHYDLSVGDTIKAKRQANNPYIVRR